MATGAACRMTTDARSRVDSLSFCLRSSRRRAAATARCELDPLHIDPLAPLAHDRLEMARPFVVGGGLVHVRASVGLAMFPDDAPDAQSLRQLADEAMYRAKRAGGGRAVTAASTPAGDSATAAGSAGAAAVQVAR